MFRRVQLYRNLFSLCSWQSGPFFVLCFNQSAFQQVFASLLKTQLNLESFQQLRKIYGDLECQYCGKVFKACLLLCWILIPIQNFVCLYSVIFLALGFTFSTGKLFWYKVHYNVHVRTHTKEHSHYCSKCSYSSITKSSLKRHQIQKHSGLQLSCSSAGCKYTTPDKYKLQAHLRMHQYQVSNLKDCSKANSFLLISHLRVFFKCVTVVYRGKVWLVPSVRTVIPNTD